MFNTTPSQQLLMHAAFCGATAYSILLTVCLEISNRAGGYARANKKFQQAIGN